MTLFKTDFKNGRIEMSREDDKLYFSPGEADGIKELIGTALSMESLSVLPEHIDINRFQIRFFEDNTLTLSANDGEEGEIRFSWAEGDDLILSVEDGFNRAINDMQLNVGGKVPKYVNPPGFGEPFN